MGRKVLFKTTTAGNIAIVCNGIKVGSIVNHFPFNSARWYDSTGENTSGYFDVPVGQIKREFKKTYMDMPDSMFQQALVLAKNNLFNKIC